MSEHRPRITVWAQAQADWQQALLYIDRRRSLRHVLSHADVGIALAVERFGPHLLRAKQDPSGLWDLHLDPDSSENAVRNAVQELEFSCLRRLVEVVDDGRVGELIDLGMRLDSAVASAAPWWQALDNLSARRDFNALATATRAQAFERASVVRVTQSPERRRSPVEA
mgnify:CR=1 FL=1